VISPELEWPKAPRSILPGSSGGIDSGKPAHTLSRLGKEEGKEFIIE